MDSIYDTMKKKIYKLYKAVLNRNHYFSYCFLQCLKTMMEVQVNDATFIPLFDSGNFRISILTGVLKEQLNSNSSIQNILDKLIFFIRDCKNKYAERGMSSFKAINFYLCYKGNVSLSCWNFFGSPDFFHYKLYTFAYV